MGTHILLLVLGIIVQFCNVLSRHNFYEYYYSRYHRDPSTTTESIFLSTSDNFAFSKYGPDSFPPDDNSLPNNMYEVTGDTAFQNNMYEPTGERHKFHHAFMSRTLLIVGSIVAFLIIIGVIVCWCPKCCRGTEYRNYNRRNNIETATEVVPQQPIVIPYPVQQASLQHLSVQEQTTPEYQPRIMQQQPQWSQVQYLPVQYPQQHFHPEYQPQMQPHCSLGQHFSQQHPREHFLPEYMPHVACQQPRDSQGQHSYNLPEAPPPYESHIKY